MNRKFSSIETYQEESHMHFQFVSSLLGVTVLCTGLAAVLTPVSVATAQAQEIAQGGSAAAPIGQINPREPVTMKIVNSTSFPLFASTSGGTRVELDPNDDTDFTFDSTPINVFVYPATGEASLEYETTIQGNALTVRVVRGTGVTPGDGTINIRPSGSVFVF